MGYPKGRPRISAAEHKRRSAEREDLAGLVRAARVQLGEPAEGDYPGQAITQQQLADMLGRTRSLVAAWEAERKRPTDEDIAAIRALLEQERG
jgi:ribosome-binding protein aMBF1 (putative translation factor)